MFLAVVESGFTGHGHGETIYALVFAHGSNAILVEGVSKSLVNQWEPALMTVCAKLTS